MENVKHEGATIKLGRTEYVAAPLTLKGLRSLLPRMAKLNVKNTGLPSDEDLDVIVDVIHASLARNYQDISKEAIEDELTINNIHEVLSGVLKASGLEPGNVRAATAEAKPTGDVSTGS